MNSKNLNTSLTIPIWQVIGAALLLYLLPPPAIIEKILLSVLKYEWSVWVVKILILMLIIMVPIYLHQKSTRPLTRKEKEELLQATKEIIESRYESYCRHVLSKQYDEAINNEASRGFEYPSGSLNGAIWDLYLSDIKSFSEIVEETLSKASININTKNLHSYIDEFIENIMDGHCRYIIDLYSKFIDGMFSNMNKDWVLQVKKDFSKQAKKETELSTKYLQASNKIYKIHTTNQST